MNEDLDGTRGGRGYLVIALASCAILVYEIAATRILSVVLGYHFAFVAISLAMLGLGVPGVWFALRPARPGLVGTLLLVAGIAVPTSVTTLCRSPEVIGGEEGVVSFLGMTFERVEALTVVMMVAILVPMLLLGAAVCLLLLEARGRRIARMYGSDLLGATAGALAIVPLMHVFPTPSIVAATGLLALVGAWLRGRRRTTLVLAAVVVGSLAWQAPYRVRHNKHYDETKWGLLYEKWTPTARLTVFPRHQDGAFGWGMGSKYEEKDVQKLWIDQDGAAGTPVEHGADGIEGLDHLDFDVTNVGYHFRHPDTVCVIGAGGGRDVVSALRSGATRVDAVELNRHMIATVDERFGDFSGHPYSMPGVVEHASEGRSFLTRTDRTFDLIQISLIDSYAATAAGAFALSENYLYTLEALELYWRRLNDGGLISISRWMQGRQQMESARLALMVEQALREEGVEEPLEHLAILQARGIATFLISRTPFGPDETARLDEIARTYGFIRHWPLPEKPPKRSLVNVALLKGPAAFDERGLDLSAATDDRPFFFQTLHLLKSTERKFSTMAISDRAVVVLRLLVVGLSITAVLLFFSPFLLAGRMKRHPGFWKGSGYFAAIGMAFMLVEIPLLQKLILYLGHPSYATTVVLAGMLLGSGAGSMVAGGTSLARAQRSRFLLPAAVAAVNLLLPLVVGASLGSSFAIRVALSLAIIVPLGFVMGFAFPIGMIRFGDENKAWFWAMNGVTSVLASVCSLALAILLGFTWVVWAGVLAYLAACVLLPGEEAAAASPRTA